MASHRAKRLPIAKAPKQNPYTAFVKATYHQAEGNSLAEKIKTIGAQWRGLIPQEKAQWAVGSQSLDGTRTAEGLCDAHSVYEKRQTQLSAPSKSPNPKPEKNRQSVMSLYVKAMMAEAPKGSSQEKLRFIGAQWRALSSTEKAVWAQKVADFGPKVPPKASQDAKRVVKAASPWRVEPMLVTKVKTQNAYSAFTQAMFNQVEGNCITEKAKNIGALWRTLSPHEKAEWAARARSLVGTRIVEVLPQKTPKCRSAYQTFLHDRLPGPRLSLPSCLIATLPLRLLYPRHSTLHFSTRKSWHYVPITPQSTSPTFFLSPWCLASCHHSSERLQPLGGSMAEVAGEWKALVPDVKDQYARRAAEWNASRATRPEQRSRKLRNGYHIFLLERLPVLGGSMSLAVAEWKALGPEVKEQYARRAAELNASLASPQRGLLNAVSLYVKASMAKAPQGTQQERMRHLAAQWKCLSSEEKTTWAHKAAVLRVAPTENAPGS